MDTKSQIDLIFKELPEGIEKLLRSKNLNDIRLGVEMTIDLMGENWCKENFNFIPNPEDRNFGNFPTFDQVYPINNPSYLDCNIMRDSYLIHIGSCSIQYIDSKEIYFQRAKKYFDDNNGI